MTLCGWCVADLRCCQLKGKKKWGSWHWQAVTEHRNPAADRFLLPFLGLFHCHVVPHLSLASWSPTNHKNVLTCSGYSWDAPGEDFSKITLLWWWREEIGEERGGVGERERTTLQRIWTPQTSPKHTVNFGKSEFKGRENLSWCVYGSPVLNLVFSSIGSRKVRFPASLVLLSLTGLVLLV